MTQTIALLKAKIANFDWHINYHNEQAVKYASEQEVYKSELAELMAMGTLAREAEAVFHSEEVPNG